jgi:hypothetical protein
MEKIHRPYFIAQFKVAIDGQNFIECLRQKVNVIFEHRLAVIEVFENHPQCTVLVPVRQGVLEYSARSSRVSSKISYVPTCLNRNFSI